MKEGGVLENPLNGRQVKVENGMYRYVMMKIYIIAGMTNDVNVATKFLLEG